jgi:hypothetical protein
MSNGIKWQFEEPNMYSNEQAEALEKSILDTGAVKDSEKMMVSSFCILLVHTRGLNFDPAKVKSESLKKLPNFLASWNALTPQDLWEYRRKHISHPVWNQWGNDYSNENGLFVTDPSELPDEALTPEQRDEAARQGSPLA